jgi:acetyl esterase/lipase
MNYLPEPKEGIIVPVSIPVPESERTALASQVRTILSDLAPDLEIPELDVQKQVQGEWQGISSSPHVNDMSIRERFAALSASVEDGPVLFHLHGGGYITGSVAMERTATFRMAKTTGARVFGVEYRAAPQNPFPAALLDVLVAYKYLLDPPEDALHEPISPSKIVVSGDSAGVLPPVFGADRRAEWRSRSSCYSRN